MRRTKNVGIFITGALLLFFILPQQSYSQMREVIDTREEQSAWVYKGDLIALKVYSLTRIAITKPGIVQVANADPDELLLVGQSPGETSIFVWDEYGKRKVVVLCIQEDLDIIMVRMLKLLENAEIDTLTLEKDMIEGKIIVTGRVPKHKFADADEILNQFSGSIVNLAKEDEGALIQVDTQVTELTTTLNEAAGFDWNTGGSGLGFTYTETIPTFDGSPQDWFKIGEFQRTTSMLVLVENLITEGKARVLSNPKIVVTNGKEASFQVGGEIPVRRTTTSSGGNVTEDITFKSYGIDVSITPTIINDKIDIELDVTIRDIDASNAVGSDVAFTTRTATTELYLNDNQTIILAGLIKHNEGETYKKVPWLGDIPVIGAFFRHKENASATTDTEVVISLTPRILNEEGIPLAEAKKMEMLIEDKKSEMEMIDVGSATGEASGDINENKEDLSIRTDEKTASLKEEDEASMEMGEDMALETKNDLDMSINELLAERQETEDLLEDAIGLEEKEVSSQLTNYVQDIQKRIAASISYPYKAKEKGWEGTVRLTMIILSDGSLNEVYVLESSGHDVFDKDAMNTTQILSPFDPFPPDIDLEEVTVTIPIIYSQDSILGNSLEGARLDKTIMPKTVVNSPEEMSQETYENIVSRKISKQAIYPKVAKDNGWEGEVKMNLRILRNGILADVSLEQSSGYELIDVCSLKLAKEASPYNQFPSSWQSEEIKVTVPLVYELSN